MITRHTVTDRRTMLTPWFGGTAANNWRDGHPATYDAPFAETTLVVYAFKAGKELPAGYTVDVTVLGEGTTVERFERDERVMSDVWEYVPYVTYRDEAGNWITTQELASDDVTIDATAEVLEAREAYLAAQAEEKRLAGEAQAKEATVARAKAQRAAVSKGKFVVVSRGKKVPVGTVGRVFWEDNSLAYEGRGRYAEEKCGIAASTLVAANGRAADAHWPAVKNCDVLLQAMPSDPAEVALLYRFASAVADHAYPVGEGRCVAEVTELFPAAWAKALAEPWRLAVALACPVGDMPRLSAKERYTLAEVLEMVESHTGLCNDLARMVAEYDGSDVCRAAIVATVNSALTVRYVPKARKAKAPKGEVVTA